MDLKQTYKQGKKSIVLIYVRLYIKMVVWSYSKKFRLALLNST